ncbi:MAG: TlpA family protein disulfide reductase [Deltaproteobacteria bacterium]|nr:TlpA family protein disulfide reductase [Deltaproteobacteria bacterium]
MTDSAPTPSSSEQSSSEQSSSSDSSSETFARVVRVGLIVLMSVIIATSLMDTAAPMTAGQPAPELFLRSYDGKAWNLNRFKGKPVVLNFWGSWCPPCMAELPSFVKAANDHPDLQFIGATVGSDPTEVFATIKRFRIPYAIAEVDSHGTESWGAKTLPSTFLLDEHHNVVFSTRGQMSHKKLEQAIDQYLLGKGAEPTK